MMVLLTSEWPTASVNQQTDGRASRQRLLICQQRKPAGPAHQFSSRSRLELKHIKQRTRNSKGGSLGVNTAVVKTKPRCQVPLHRPHQVLAGSWSGLRCRFPGPRWLTGQNAINDTTFPQLAAFVHVCVSVHVYLVERVR
ncbi:hypothetical protein CDEST_11068 [Colletotrichum destructivum]|uniref:Uncharacterized protein n=1 Tax=Colletotrichum destructivum TaxID=34406 RepID=A0AAX4IS60_9PEZI|nr:hypothetical protein CDEST_11068 [Colletotrichum destructivum]